MARPWTLRFRVTFWLVVAVAAWIDPGGLPGQPQPALRPPAITMYDTEFEADAFVWCIDRSCSMGWGNAIDTVKAEITSAIHQLDSNQEFSLISFSDGAQVFSSVLLPAIPANKMAALAWVAALNPDGGTCITPALTQALAIADFSLGDGQVLFVGDGLPTCADATTTIAEVSIANTSQIPINSFFVGTNTGAYLFLQQLAAVNSGEFVDTNPTPLPRFRRGDVNGDGFVNVSDAIVLLEHLFAGGPAQACPDASDVNGDTSLAMDDPITLLGYLFSQGPPPPTPGPDLCGLWNPTGLGDCTGQPCP